MSSELQAAYDTTDFEVVETGAGVEVPTSKPAVFEYENPDTVTSAAQVQNALESGDYAFIAPSSKEKDNGRFYLSSKVYHSGTNEFLHLKVNGNGVRVFPKDEEFSFEAFTAVIERLESQLGTELVPRLEDSEEDSADQ